MHVINKNKGVFKGRYGHSCCMVDNGKNLLIFGGSEDEKKNDIIRFELSSGNFYRIQACQEDEKAPSARDFHTGLMSSHNTMVIIGVRI